jgi:hypothetical protein
MKTSYYALLVTLALSACASTDKTLETKMAQEAHVKNNRDLRKEADTLIQNDQQLSPDQKASLTALRKSISDQTDSINKQELRLRSVLTEELLSPASRCFSTAWTKATRSWGKRTKIAPP